MLVQFGDMRCVVIPSTESAESERELLEFEICRVFSDLVAEGKFSFK